MSPFTISSSLSSSSCMSQVQLRYLPASHSRRVCVRKVMVSPVNPGVSVNPELNQHNPMVPSMRLTSVCLFRHRFRQLSHYSSWVYRISQQALLHLLHKQKFRELENRPFRSTVGTGMRSEVMSCSRVDIDHRLQTVLGAQQEWCEMFAHQKCSFEVDFKRLPPKIFISIHDWESWCHEASVIDQYVQPHRALLNLGGCSRHRCTVCHIELNAKDCGSSSSTGMRCSLYFSLRLSEIIRTSQPDERGSGFRVRQGNSLADSAVPTSAKDRTPS